MSDINIIKKISETSTQLPESRINLTFQGKPETYHNNTYKTNTHFDTDKSLINIPKRMIIKSNDLNIVNTNSSISNYELDQNHSIVIDYSKLGVTERHTEESIIGGRRTFTEKTIYEEINKAEKNIENMEYVNFTLGILTICQPY
jgi:hypothetical protein